MASHFYFILVCDPSYSLFGFLIVDRKVMMYFIVMLI